MKVFMCVEFKGHYPIGTAAVTVADDIECARRNFNEALKESGLPDLTSDDEITEIPTHSDYTVIMCEGNY